MGHKKEKKIHRALKIYGVWALLVVLVNLAAGVVPGLGAGISGMFSPFG